MEPNCTEVNCNSLVSTNQGASFCHRIKKLCSPNNFVPLSVLVFPVIDHLRTFVYKVSNFCDFTIYFCDNTVTIKDLVMSNQSVFIMCLVLLVMIGNHGSFLDGSVFLN